MSWRAEPAPSSRRGMPRPQRSGLRIPCAGPAERTSRVRAMSQHSNGYGHGKAMAHRTARDMWRPDPEFWSANRAEHRFADGYELVAFDLPAANGYPAIIGWELFGGLEYMTLVASGQAASLGEGKAACEAVLVQALAALRQPPKA